MVVVEAASDLNAHVLRRVGACDVHFGVLEQCRAFPDLHPGNMGISWLPACPSVNQKRIHPLAKVVSSVPRLRPRHITVLNRPVLQIPYHIPIAATGLTTSGSRCPSASTARSLILRHHLRRRRIIRWAGLQPYRRVRIQVADDAL